jgi:hypothetical protein
MKTRIILSILAVFAALLLPLAAAYPATAGGPSETYTIVREYTETVDASRPDNFCGFTFYAHYVGTVHGKVWNDAKGTWLRTQETWSGTRNILYRYEGGPKIQGQASGEVTFERISATTARAQINGTNFIVTVPGYGIQWGNAGQQVIIYDINTNIGDIVKQVGVTKWYPQEIWDIVCPYIGSLK